MRLPMFAEPIVKARLSGKKPVDPVIVSLGIFNLNRDYDWPIVVCKTRENYDLSFLAGLDVYVAFNWPDSVAASKLIRAVQIDFECHSCGFFVPGSIGFQSAFLNTENQLIAMEHFYREHQKIQVEMSRETH